jgi:hypothetical protein
MKLLGPSKAVPLVICFTLILVFGATTANAQEATNISGKISAAYTQQEEIAIGDTKGHMVNLAKSEGTNENTGEYAFMEGARIVNISYSDLIKGSGSHRGYIIFADGSDTTIGKWEGMVTTTLAPDSTPVITFEGIVSYVSGTGQYEGISGSGTYKGSFTSMDAYAVEWQSEFYLKK